MPVEAKPLFRPDVLRDHLQRFTLPPSVESHRPLLDKWATMLKSERANRFNEKELLPDFLTDIFCGMLGYARPHDSPERFTFSREKHVEVDGKFADAVLGHFIGDREEFVVAVEGKGPLDPLDRPFKSRKMSAVDQGYRYAINLPCDWIIVTSMRETRLYFKGADQHTFERFVTEDLAANEALLKKFVFLLAADRVVPVVGRSHLYDLRSTSEKVGRNLTREFYEFYSLLRHDSFLMLCEQNPNESRHAVLAAAQKLLDRVLFCCFCEDRGLLPPGTVRKAFEHRDPFTPRPIWENFKGLFRSVDVGNDHLDIPPYNGGLFAPDEVLERLKVPDDICRFFLTLSGYDFRSPSVVAADVESETTGHFIDVEILGHIFEQSISDLERIRNQLDGLVKPEGKAGHKTRRKQEGAFYTPAFITRYIIEQTLGGVLADRFEALRREHADAASRSTAKVLDDPRVYDLATLTKPQRKALTEFWHAWQETLGSIRVLDPACGSGAFLIEAFDQLHAAYRVTYLRLDELRGHAELFDIDRQILQSNLYGVDLNEEAIQICRLSLWIKTAQRGKKLTSLDHTIRVGNSVVADPSVHPLAFNWQGEFPEVFQRSHHAPRDEPNAPSTQLPAESLAPPTSNDVRLVTRSVTATLGGFDVVVGNPPYIRQEWLAPFKPYWEQSFASFHGVADIFTYFYELGVKLLRPSGRLGFITSGSWVRGNFGEPLRAFLAQNAAIDSLVDFGEYQPFEDAEMIRPTIAVLTKQPPGGRMKLFKWLTTGSPPENLSEVIATAPTMRTDHLNRDVWELEPDEVLALRQKLVHSGIKLAEYSTGGILRGVLSGLTEAFVIDRATRDRLIAKDSRSAEVIKPFGQGTHLRPWYVEDSGEFLLALKSSSDFDWPWSDSGNSAEDVFKATFPAIYEHLARFKEAAIKRSDQGRYWWEFRSCGYWPAFDAPRIVWPDISKLPRFSMDTLGRCFGNTVYLIPSDDYFLLGVLSSWATWFFISKTAQPLRLRGDRWQYRLFTQSMENIPIPDASKGDREAIAQLARRCSELGAAQYQTQTHVQRRLTETFHLDHAAHSETTLNQKASAWWDCSLTELGDALKTSFKLAANPFKNPRTADDWDSYLAEHKATVAHYSHELADIEADLNARVYRLFNLTPDEIKLLQREVEH
ncbi:MAG: Eco57I restriction-modification methylase domain-containing protein [Planctomycetaceae bacterium]